MSKNLKIILGVIGVLLVAGIVVFIVIKNNNKEPEVPTPRQNEEIREKVTIKFDASGGEKVEDLVIDKGAQVLLPSTTKDGYLFDGWYLNNEKILSTYVYNDDITVVAKWEKIKENIKTFKITYDSKGGSKVNYTTLECGKTLTLPTNPTKNGYVFKGWEDKKGKSILNGAKLSCENVTLYAKWEKEEAKTPSDPTPTPEPQKTYSCPSGYTLNGTKCTIEGTVRETCPSDTRIDGSLCIKLTDYNKGTRQCKTETIVIDGKGHTWTGKGEYYEVGLGRCAYYQWTNITTQADCTTNINRKATWGNGKCYAEIKDNNYETICTSEYQYYTSEQLQSKFGAHNNGGCYRKVDKTKYCDEGYTLTSGKCIKTIDATLS